MLSKININDLKKKIEPFIDVRIFGLVIFCLMMVLVSWSGLKVLQTNYELEKKIAQLSQRNSLQHLENENLRLKNTYLESDEYLELTARRQFSKAAKGEKLYLVPESVALSKTKKIDTENQYSAEKPAPKSRVTQNLEDWHKFLFRDR